MNAQEWVDRLRRNGDVHVVQFSPAECGEMARVFREVLDRRDWLETQRMYLAMELAVLERRPVAHAGSPTLVDPPRADALQPAQVADKESEP